MTGAIGFFRMLLKFGFPAYLILVVATAIHGALRPWKPAETILAEHPGQLPITVRSFDYGGGRDAHPEQVRASREYVFFPAFLTDPKIVVVSQIDDEPAVALDERIDFWLGLLWIGLSLYGTWWFWLRRTRKGAI